VFGSEFKLAYCEDADLSLRLRERGYKLKIIEDFFLEGDRAVTTELLRGCGIDIDGYRMRNHIILQKKWMRYFRKRDFNYDIGVKRGAALGDVLLTTPILRAIKRRYPLSKITFYTACPGVLENNLDVDQIKDHNDTGRHERLLDLDLYYESRPEMHIIDAYAEKVGMEIPRDKLHIFPRDNDYKRAEKLMGAYPGPYAVINAGRTAWPGRNWTKKKFDILAERLSRDIQLVSVGNNAFDLECKSVYDLRSSLSLLALAALMRGAKYFVGIDSLPMHLAQAADIPTVGLFGCIDPAYRMLDRSHMIGVIAEDVGCLGCHHYLPAPRTSSECYRKDPICMKRIEVGQVQQAIKRVLYAKESP
jgi:ADP-heptose:LPS heptosyltransferase